MGRGGGEARDSSINSYRWFADDGEGRRGRMAKIVVLGYEYYYYYCCRALYSLQFFACSVFGWSRPRANYTSINISYNEKINNSLGRPGT